MTQIIIPSNNCIIDLFTADYNYNFVAYGNKSVMINISCSCHYNRNLFSLQDHNASMKQMLAVWKYAHTQGPGALRSSHQPVISPLSQV